MTQENDINRRVEEAVRQNLMWFRKSGVMVPSDGTWGVAERLICVQDAAVRDTILKEFGCFTDGGAVGVVESRRADCNFQVVLYHLLAGDFLGCAEARAIGEELLRFLYTRSGLLSRNADVAPLGTWNWSHAIWRTALWFDDNSWAEIVQCILLRCYPGLAQRWGIAEQATLLARALADGFRRTLERPCRREDPDKMDPDGVWNGRIQLPHWGGLVILALTAFDAWRGTREFASDAERYFTSPTTAVANNSERCYALLAASVAARFYGGQRLQAFRDRMMSEILERADRTTGNLAAEHYEAPSGTGLVDLIYTMNWLPGALQNAQSDDGLQRRVFDLLLDIQDRSSSPQLAGCWRGMFNLETRAWGGGDRVEGGAGSIYTGWTNAPVGIWMLLKRQKLSLADLILA